jgi:polygalacturonase
VRIQQALDACPPGEAVALRAAGGRNAFLSGPLQLRRGVTLLVEKGATLLGSRGPRLYDVTPGACGIAAESGRGGRALIDGDKVAGAVGDGAIDGRG